MYFSFGNDEGSFSAGPLRIVIGSTNIILQNADFLLDYAPVDIVHRHGTFGEDRAAFFRHLGEAAGEKDPHRDQTTFEYGKCAWPDVRYDRGVAGQNAKIAFRAGLTYPRPLNKI